MKENKLKGLTLLELLVVVVIISILVLISTVLLLDAAEKAKESAVRANCSAAISSLMHRFTEDADVDDIVTEVTSALNDPDEEPNNGDEVKSPFVSSLPAFVSSNSVSSGQVLIEIVDNDTIKVSGFGKDVSSAQPLLVKSVKRF